MSKTNRVLEWLKNHFPIRIKIQIPRPFTDGCDTYVAFDPEDADKAYAECVGEHRELMLEEPFMPIRLSSTETIFSEDKLKHYPLFAKVVKRDGGYSITASYWAWVLDNGRGFLCSDEY